MKFFFFFVPQFPANPDTQGFLSYRVRAETDRNPEIPVGIGSKVLRKPAVIVKRPGKGQPSRRENPQAITTPFQPILTEEPVALPPPPLAKAKWG